MEGRHLFVLEVPPALYHLGGRRLGENQRFVASARKVSQRGFVLMRTATVADDNDIWYWHVLW